MTTRHKQTAPRLRFKGFEGAWEEKILGENARFAKGSGYSKSDLTTEGLPIILYGRLYTQYESIIENVDTFVSYDENTLKSSGNEVIVPASGETAEDIARASAVYQKGVIFGGDLNVVTPNKDITPSFLALTLTHGKSNQELSKKAQGKSVVHLRNDDLKACEISFPTLLEQTQLGNFFRKLDHRITQSRALCEKSRQLKQAMLAKMFPAAGETAPKIRFKGFTGEWERKTLGEVVEIERKGKAQFQQLQAGNVPYLDAEFLNGGEKFLTDAIQDVNADDVLIIWDGSNAGKVYIGFNGVLGSTLKMYRTSLDCSPMFLYQELVRNEEVIFSQYRTPNIPHVIKDFSSEYHFLMPLYEEQIAIGNFFRQLDDTIALHALETEKLGRLKKALLAAMLV